MRPASAQRGGEAHDGGRLADARRADDGDAARAAVRRPALLGADARGDAVAREVAQRPRRRTAATCSAHLVDEARGRRRGRRRRAPARAAGRRASSSSASPRAKTGSGAMCRPPLGPRRGVERGWRWRRAWAAGRRRVGRRLLAALARACRRGGLASSSSAAGAGAGVGLAAGAGDVLVQRRGERLGQQAPRRSGRRRRRRRPAACGAGARRRGDGATAWPPTASAGARSAASTSTPRRAEEAADAAGLRLALLQDDGVGPELLADLRDDLRQVLAGVALELHARLPSSARARRRRRSRRSCSAGSRCRRGRRGAGTAWAVRARRWRRTFGRADERRAVPDGGDLLDGVAHGAHERLGAARVEPEVGAVRRLHDAVGELLLEARLEHDRPQRAERVRRGRRELARQGLAAVLGEQRRVLGEARAVAQRLEDRAEVADRDALGQQALQHAVHLAERADVGHELVDQRRVALAQVVEQHAHVLAAEQARRRARGSVSVRCVMMIDGVVDDRVAGGLGVLARGRRRSTAPAARRPARRSARRAASGRRRPGSWPAGCRPRARRARPRRP